MREERPLFRSKAYLGEEFCNHLVALIGFADMHQVKRFADNVAGALARMSGASAQTRDSGALTVEDLKVHFGGGKKLFSKDTPIVHAVDGVSFSVPSGKTFGVVGESGSGKTTTALAIIRLVHITQGRVTLGDMVISDLEKEELRSARRRNGP